MIKFKTIETILNNQNRIVLIKLIRNKNERIK